RRIEVRRVLDPEVARKTRLRRVFDCDHGKDPQELLLKVGASDHLSDFHSKTHEAVTQCSCGASVRVNRASCVDHVLDPQQVAQGLSPWPHFLPNLLPIQPDQTGSNGTGASLRPAPVLRWTWTQRSRKPLGVQAPPGFKSLPLGLLQGSLQLRRAERRLARVRVYTELF